MNGREIPVAYRAGKTVEVTLGCLHVRISRSSEGKPLARRLMKVLGEAAGIGQWQEATRCRWQRPGRG